MLEKFIQMLLRFQTLAQKFTMGDVISVIGSLRTGKSTLLRFINLHVNPLKTVDELLLTVLKGITSNIEYFDRAYI